MVQLKLTHKNSDLNTEGKGDIASSSHLQIQLDNKKWYRKILSNYTTGGAVKRNIHEVAEFNMMCTTAGG